MRQRLPCRGPTTPKASRPLIESRRPSEAGLLGQRPVDRYGIAESCRIIGIWKAATAADRGGIFLAASWLPPRQALSSHIYHLRALFATHIRMGLSKGHGLDKTLPGPSDDHTVRLPKLFADACIKRDTGYPYDCSISRDSAQTCSVSTSKGERKFKTVPYPGEPSSSTTFSREAHEIFRLIDSLVAALDPPNRPSHQRNVVRSTDLHPHLAHQAKESVWIHSEIATHLPVGSSVGESSQYNGFIAGQTWVQLESRIPTNADQVVSAFHRSTAPLRRSATVLRRGSVSWFSSLAEGARTPALFDYKAASASPSGASIAWPPRG